MPTTLTIEGADPIIGDRPSWFLVDPDGNPVARFWQSPASPLAFEFVTAFPNQWSLRAAGVSGLAEAVSRAHRDGVAYEITGSPPRLPVVSSNLASVAYNDASGSMEVEFKGGRVYRYDGVPADVYGGLMTAESAGKFFAAKVRNVYDCTRVDGGAPE